MGRKIGFYDTETSGLPLYTEKDENGKTVMAMQVPPEGGAEKLLPVWVRSKDPRQPHLAEIAVVLVDEDTRAVLEQFTAIVKPDGWTIAQETVDVHGIDDAIAAALGIPEAEALDGALRLLNQADVRIGYNEPFDARILRIAINRYLSPEAAEAFRARRSACAMQAARVPCAIPNKGNRKGIKLPTQSEAHEKLLGVPLDDAHGAFEDVLGLVRIYWALVDRGVAVEKVGTDAEEPAPAVAGDTIIPIGL